MRFLDVTLDTYQNTSGYMYLGLFITIHQDTPRYKIMIHVSCTRHDDTSRYNQDTCMIHARLIKDTCGINLSALVRGYMRDTCGIFPRYILGYMYLKCILRGTYLRCRIHAGYMQDTSICKGNQDTCGIHPKTSEIHDEIHVSQIHPRGTRGTSRPQVRAKARDTYPRMYVCIRHVSCMYLVCHVTKG